MTAAEAMMMVIACAIGIVLGLVLLALCGIRSIMATKKPDPGMFWRRLDQRRALFKRDLG